MIRFVLRAILESIRFEWRMQRALRRMEPAGLEALFTAPGVPCLNEPRFFVLSLNPVKVGRQAVEGDAIRDVVRWLECSGWYGEDQGALQCYAVWLLRRRAAYERGAEVPS